MKAYTMSIDQLREHLWKYGKEYPVTVVINGEYYDLTGPMQEPTRGPEFWEY